MFSCPAHKFILITMRGCVAYIHDSDSTLTFDIKVKLRGYLLCLCVWPITLFAWTLAYHIWHLCLSPWENVSSTFMILIQPWTFTSRWNFMGLCHGFLFKPQLFCPLTVSYFVWHVSVSLWYFVSCTFMNSVWPWPLTSISK